MPRTIKELAQEAHDIQDAVNLSGVVHAFSRAISDLREIARAEGWENTDKLNNHPICVMFSDKIAQLTYSSSCTTFQHAYGWVSDTIGKKDATESE